MSFKNDEGYSIFTKLCVKIWTVIIFSFFYIQRSDGFPEFTVGRINSCYNIKDDTVSRRHCTFTSKDNTWTLKNFSSSGTFINGCPLKCNETKAIFDKDVIQFGPRKRYTFIFHADEKEYEEATNKKSRLDDCNENANTKEEKDVSEPSELKALKRKIETLEEEALETNKRIRTLMETVKTLQAESDAKDSLLEEYKNKLKDTKKSLRTHRTEHINLKEQIAFLANALETELMCTICNELMYDILSVSCGHMFCKYCLTEWKRKNTQCPLCRVVMTSDAPAVALNSFLYKIAPKLPEEMKAARRRLIEERGGKESDLKQLKSCDVVDLTKEDRLRHSLPHSDGPANDAAVCAASFVDLTEGNDSVDVSMFGEIEID